MPSPSARRATWRPIRPRPRTPSVFPASSTPVKRWRSQMPAVERRVRLRHVASEREEKRDRVLGSGVDGRLGSVRDDDPAPGRRVDVDVVDPRRPPARSPSAASARSMSAASSVVAERITIASKSPMIDARSDSTSSTTSNRRRRSSRPASAIGSRTRTRGSVRHARRRGTPRARGRPPRPRSIGAPRSTRSVSTAVSAVVMSSTS